MNFYTVATIVRAKLRFISDEHVVAKDLNSLIGGGVKTLIIEFDQATYEKFFQGSTGSFKPTHSFRRICVASSAPCPRGVPDHQHACPGREGCVNPHRQFQSTMRAHSLA